MRHFFLFLFSIIPFSALPQAVSINTDSSQPNPNAILDVRSSNKGILIPRLGSFARKALPNVQGLLLYDSTTNSFWYNNGIIWKDLSIAGSEWLITGNSGTNPTTNFIGTSDNVPLTIRVNNVLSGLINQNTENTSWGYNSGNVSSGIANTGVGSSALSLNTGAANTAIGAQALRTNTTGFNNTAVGYNSIGANITGGNNTAMGYESLDLNTTGMNNTAVGHQALLRNTSGFQNTSIGLQSLYSNRVGANNTAAGIESLWNNTTGNSNVAIGGRSQFNNQVGNQNNSIGYESLYNNTGSNNTALGYHALYSNSSGNGNTAIGYDANVSSGTLTNATAIGYSTTVDASNKVRIGNAAVTIIEGQVPFTIPSDGRYKFNFRDDISGLDFILRLHPVSYNFDVKRFDSRNQSNVINCNQLLEKQYIAASLIRRSGFIAQEVEKAALDANFDFSGIIKPSSESDHYSLSYESFVVPLVKAVQEQQNIISIQRRKINELEERLKNIEIKINQMKD